MSYSKKGMGAYVVETPYDDCVKEGQLVHLSEDQADALGSFVREATPDDLNTDEPDNDDGDDSNDDTPPLQDNNSVPKNYKKLVNNLANDVSNEIVKRTKATNNFAGAVPATVKKPVFKCMGELLKTRFLAAQGNMNAMRQLSAYNSEIRGKVALGANEGTNTQGGYFLKPTWYKDVWDKIRDYPKLLDLTDRITITGNTLNINAINETGLADGQRHAGVLGYWVNEAASLTSTFPVETQIVSVINTNVVFVYSTVQLLEDANIESFDKKISELAMLELLWQEDNTVINGSGSGQPLGILNQPSLITVTKNSGTSAGTFAFADLAAMWKALYPPSRPNAVWLMNPECYNSLMQMAFQATGTTSAGTYPANGLSYNFNDQETPLRIFGKPVIECLMAPQAGLPGDILLCDMKQLICAEHPQVYADVSEHLQFNTMQVAFRFYRRYDVQSPWKTSLTSVDGHYSYSPFVALQSRGT